MNNRFSLEGKTALVTGAAGLLGKEHTKALLESGAKVIMLDLDSKVLNLAREEVCKNSENSSNLSCVICDITNEKEVSLLKEKLDQQSCFVDVLVNNAAINPAVGSTGLQNLGRLESLSIDALKQEINVGLIGALICTKIFGLAMAKRGSGSIINISSDLGVIAPNQSLYSVEGKDFFEQNVKPVGYSIIKHGIIGLTRYVSTYWAAKGVRCNAISPGGVQVDQDQEFINRVSNLVPMGRMAKLNEIQGAIIYLASDASSYVNGANIVVDGGRSVW